MQFVEFAARMIDVLLASNNLVHRCRMANTYTSLHYHLLFSTKNRQRWIRPDIEARIWKYLGGIARDNKPQMVGLADSIHPTIMRRRSDRT